MAEKCIHDIKCIIVRENHPAFAQSCYIYNIEKEILEVKYRRDVKRKKENNLLIYE